MLFCTPFSPLIYQHQTTILKQILNGFEMPIFQTPLIQAAFAARQSSLTIKKIDCRYFSSCNDST